MKKITLLLFVVLLANIVSAQTFNLEIDLPETYESVPQGENIWFTIKLVNLASQERIDVTLKYEIFDINGQLKALKTETVAVETQASFVGNLKVSEDLEKGIYFLKVTLTSPFSQSESEIFFNVIEEQTKVQILLANALGIYITFSIFLIPFVILFFTYRFLRGKNYIEKIIVIFIVLIFILLLLVLIFNPFLI